MNGGHDGESKEEKDTYGVDGSGNGDTAGDQEGEESSPKRHCQGVAPYQPDERLMPPVEKVAAEYAVNKYRCDACKEGFMRFTGLVFATMPPWYEHKCDKCADKEEYREIYPQAVVNERPRYEPEEESGELEGYVGVQKTRKE